MSRDPRKDRARKKRLRRRQAQWENRNGGGVWNRRIHEAYSATFRMLYPEVIGFWEVTL